MNAIYLSFQPLPSTMPQTTMPAAKLLWNSMSADTFNGMRLRTSSHEHGLLIINLLSHITYHFRCLEHVVNLTNVAVMSHIIKIAIIENSNAIWKYDPKLPVIVYLVDHWMLLQQFVHQQSRYVLLAIFMHISTVFLRSKHQDNALNTSRNYTSNSR